MKLSDIKVNPNNPRLIKDDRFKKLVQSIMEFPKMMKLRPIIIDGNMNILGGNMRYAALKELEYKEIPDDWIKKTSDLTEKEMQRFIIADNIQHGDWEWGLLTEWDSIELDEWGLDLPNFITDQDKADEVNEQTEWAGMPDFDPIDTSLKIVFHFKTEQDRELFMDEYKFKMIKRESRTWSTKWPFSDRDDLKSVKFE
jgi:hypothetical protein